MPESEDKQKQEETVETQEATDSEAERETEQNDELAEALREKDQFKRLAQRAQADLVNYRRRIDSEQESSRLRNQRRIVLRFADVIDQLGVALGSDTPGDVDADWLAGITVIQKNFNNALTTEGFERFDSLGEEFDPRKHEALLSSPSADYEPNTVMRELRPGYLHNKEVVRPAQVEIAIAPPAEEPE